MIAKILLLLLFITFLTLSLIAGYIGCILWICFTTIPILVGLTSLLGLISCIIIYKQNLATPTLKKASLSLIIIYPLLAYIIFWISTPIFLDFHNDSYSAQIEKRAELKEKGIPEIGTISKNGQNLIYECKSCKFRVSFPENWQWNTESVDFNNKKDPYLNLYLKSPEITPKPDNPSIAHFILYEGFSINSSSTDNTDLLAELKEEHASFFEDATFENINVGETNYIIASNLHVDNWQGKKLSRIWALTIYNGRRLLIQVTTFEDDFDKTMSGIKNLLNRITLLD